MFDRRGFLKASIGAIVAAILLPARRAFAKKMAVGLDKAEALKTVGGSVTLKIKDRSILFVRDTEATVRAYDPTCPHQNCSVAWNAKAANLQCPCHASSFSPDGKVLSGPSPRPIRTYECSLSGERIIVTLDD
jgi:cytochrome b6-f complex iron-sulfur subunit